MTVIELMVVLAILGVVTTLAAPSLMGTTSTARLRDASIEVSGGLSYARSEAIRTGNIHLVFLQEDAGLDPLNSTLGDSGSHIEMLIVNDGRPGSANQNCQFDSGENTVTVRGWIGISQDNGSEGNKVPSDIGLGDVDTGSTFLDPDGNRASWVLFRPEGSPRSFNAACDVGKLGSGAGAFYLTNNERTSAVVVTPMGGTRIYTSAGNGWSE